MKKLIFLILLFLSCNQVAKENSNSDNQSQVQYGISLDKNVTLEERLKAINKSLSLGKKGDSLFSDKFYQKQFLHFSLKQYDSVLIYSSEIEKNITTKRDYSNNGKQHHLIGYFYDEILINFDSAFYHYNLSKSNFLRINDSLNIGRRLISMGLIQKNQNDFFGSKETITEALHFLNPNNDIKYIAQAYNILGTNHRKLLNHSEANTYYFLAVKTTNSLKDKLIYQNNLATSFIDEKHYDKAINLLKKIEKDSTLKNSQTENARVLDNLAYAEWLSGKASNENEFQKSLVLRKQNNDQRGQIASYTHLGEYYSKTNIVKATSYFDSVIQLSKTLKIPRAEKDALKFLMKLKPKNISIRDRYVFLQDSLYTQETKVKTQFAKYKYDDKVTQEENLRLEKEYAEKELEANQQRTQKMFSYILGGVLLFILSFIAYFFMQRSKRLKEQNKTAKLEATYETEAELSRKLHDDFGGKLNHAMLLLQSDANNEEVLDIVDGLYNQSRNFSREINDVDTGPNFKNFLFGMMGNYCKNRKLMTTGSTEVDWLILSPLSKKTLFKVMQELMINMQKHSNATLISIVFEQTNKILKITYADDGVGASKEELDIKNGLWNTEKRIKAIGGTIIFDSEKGQGFEAQLQIPN